MFKKWLTIELSVVFLAFGSTVLTSCQEKLTEKKEEPVAVDAKKTPDTPKKALSKNFKGYWYAGDAEITSYALQQARYGELREGKAVKIFVTEPFLKDKQVKADGKNPDNIPILKLNATKNYLTGIYPYSIMTSSFYPVHDNQHALKVAFSSQEWCGQVYAQLNNREEFQISSHSYFETEADEDIRLEKTDLEDEIWNKIRIDPYSLPTGKFKIIPSLEFIRLTHKDLKAYDANAKLSSKEGITSYEIKYPDLNRTLTINFTETFPFSIESWTDAFTSGYGANEKILTSTATKIKRLKTPYWNQNKNKHLSLRDSLGL
ncbi:septum formation inhibitor Maf [Maribacter chungangensis]|uniref:Septum formation inhibitor Maf n=1 Tax=Maribacter chungangensis TaxID=1069117 RepID=A0ABW3B5J3_9FLAO